MSKHEEYVRDFVKRNREDLEERPSAFFSVSLAAQDGTEAARTQTREYVGKFAQETGCYHNMAGIFAGALWYTHYGFVKRYLMKRSQEIRAAPTPTPRTTTSTLTGTTSGTQPRSS
jgi:menaquinone-dependent protoporphyrinogen oxidase